MKALSIKQPWASLIAHGIKDIENRTWKTNYRGRIYIHASGTPSFKDIINNLSSAQLEDVINHSNLFSMNADSKSYPKSAIIGEVDIVDCVINHPSVWAEPFFTKTTECPECKCTEYVNENLVGDKYRECRECGQEWWTDINYTGKGTYNWVLENAILYDNPILNVKGKLSLWEYQ